MFEGETIQVSAGDTCKVNGQLSKMEARLSAHNHLVEYTLPVGEQRIALNPLLGKRIRLEYQGSIHCVHCQRLTKKSFNQGYCYPCFKKLARCDRCIMSPEKCHFAEGTCREPEWAEQYCLSEHIVYLSNTSGIKVGITRATQMPTRWIDQGATQALPILSVSQRLYSGLIEHTLKQYVADKTQWQTMLKGNNDEQDMPALKQELLGKIQSELTELQTQYGDSAFRVLDDAETIAIRYPVERFPTKVKSFNFDKQPLVEGVLEGIKGQYLILDGGVINIRKFTAYQVEFSA